MDAEIDDDLENALVSISHNIDDLIQKTDYTRHTLLHWAVQNNKADLCLELISKGCNVDHTDSFGATPLMLACYNGFDDIAQMLLGSGARIDITNDFGVDAVGMACANDHLDIVKMLSDFIASCHVEEDNRSNESWARNCIILSAACTSRQCLTYFYHLDKQTIHLTNEISGMNALMLAEAGNFNEIKSDLLMWGAVRNHSVKPFVPKLSLPTLLTPFTRIPPMLSPSPLPMSPCCSRQQSVFLFPSQTHGSPYPLNQGSPCLQNIRSNHLSPLQTNISHPLTPNICFSPKKTKNDEKKKSNPLSWLKKLKRKRSRSVENLTEVRRKKSSDIDHDNILDYILSTANLSEYKSTFINQEVSFRTFLTLNEEDLIEIGIRKPKVRKRLLGLIQHYKRIFHSQ